jgi:hypothetical protein
LPESGNILHYDGQVPAPSSLALGALCCALIGWRVRRRPAASGLR